MGWLELFVDLVHVATIIALTCPRFLYQVLCWSESGCSSERRSQVEHGRTLGYWS